MVKTFDDLRAENREQDPVGYTKLEMIGTLLAKRNRLGWSQKMLAEKTGIPQESISRLENGKVDAPKLSTLTKMAEAMDMEIIAQEKRLHSTEGLDRSNYKDMSKYRDGREQSRVAQTWLNKYKQQIMTNIIYRDGNPDSVSEATLEAVHRGGETTAEIVADTMIGWLNSPVGRAFISEAYGVEIPRTPEDGSE